MSARVRVPGPPFLPRERNLSDGTPASGVRVAGRSLDFRGYYAHALTDEHGRYKLGPLPAGRIAAMAASEWQRMIRFMNGGKEPGAVELVIEGRRQEDGVDLEFLRANP